jgi:hypothetical protein
MRQTKITTEMMSGDYMKEVEVLIQFDLTQLDKEKRDKLNKVEKLLRDIGISFDTGSGCGGRDWEWDWSLKGPVKVFVKRYKQEEKEHQNRFNF